MLPGGGQRLAELCTKAVARLQQRAVVALPIAPAEQAGLPPTLYSVREVPHGWLFARVAAVVHHGGAGTTGAALAAGVPNVVVPFTADQGFWGHRVASLGAGPRPIPLPRLTVDRLTHALDQALHDNGMQSRARALGERIRSEDGIAVAIRAIRAWIGPPSRSDRAQHESQPSC